MNPGVGFRTEGNEHVGLGHLKECLSLAKRLENQYAVRSLFIISSDTVDIQGFGDFVPAVERLPAETGEEDAKLTSQILEEYGLNLLVVNLKSVSPHYLRDLKEKGFTLICIDELGNKEIMADVVINGSIVEDWHRYQLRNQSATTYFGPEYMVMDEAFGIFHGKKRPIRGRAKGVLVSMGGADPSGATLRVIGALDKLDKEIEKVIVIGPAFPHHSKLRELVPMLVEDNFQICRAVSNMAELMFKADVAISHGGDTLYELACVGTPNLVLYEVEHERIQASVFEKKGATICLGKGTEVPLEEITSSVSHLLQDEALRKEMSRQGKKLVDGKGAEIVCAIILDKLRCLDTH